MGESEAYKLAIAAQREADELEALQREQQQLLAASTPATAAAPVKAPDRSSMVNNHAQNFAAWPQPVPIQAKSHVSPSPQQAPVPITATQQSTEAINKIAQQVDEIEDKVHSPIERLVHSDLPFYKLATPL